MYSDNPLRDMEESQRDKRPVIGQCIICSCDIHGESSTEWEDDYYDFGEGKVCENCLPGYIEDHRNV